MKIENGDDALILLCAFRYSLGRMSYMPSIVCAEIKKQWWNLTENDRKRIHEEIRDAIERGTAGMDIDIRTWETLLDLPCV